MPYRELADAIVESAFVDYKNLSMFLKKHPENRAAGNALKKLKNFIYSDRFSAISDINVQYMLKKIDEFVEGDGKKCISVGIS